MQGAECGEGFRRRNLSCVVHWGDWPETPPQSVAEEFCGDKLKQQIQQEMEQPCFVPCPGKPAHKYTDVVIKSCSLWLVDDPPTPQLLVIYAAAWPLLYVMLVGGSQLPLTTPCAYTSCIPCLNTLKPLKQNKDLSSCKVWLLLWLVIVFFLYIIFIPEAIQ